MKILFLGQGYNIDTHKPVGQYLIDSLKSKEYTAFTGISAFASDAAIKQLSEYLIDSELKSINLIVGIDQKGTPKTALEEILKLDVNSYIFYQKENPIFHPKIYLFENETKTLLIIGSSNMTGTGLFTNIESSILFEFDNADEQGSTLIRELKTHYRTLFDFSDRNLFKITSETIQYFVEAGIVPERIDWSTNNKKVVIDNNESPINRTLEIPKREVAKIPRKYKPKQEATAVEIEEEAGVEIDKTIHSDELNLLWISKKLTIRDLNIPTSGNTNPSGSMLFGKGQMKNIDQRHYFRDIVFKDAKWLYDKAKGKEHIERAEVLFNIYTEGVFRGQYSLKVKHDTRTDSPSYKQSNSMTAVSWGIARQVISKREYLGKIARLYLSPQKPNEFTLVIE